MSLPATLRIAVVPIALSVLGVRHGDVPRSTTPIAIDGRIDEPAWEGALAIELRYEVSPADNAPAPVRTVCLLAYDARMLYVAFRAFDPHPEAIRAHVADRDTVYRNDHVGIVIDPFHDGRRGFNFMANPLGVQMDASATDVGGSNGSFSAALLPSEDGSWDAIWESAGRITADGYEVELAIPFSSLRFPREPGAQTWGVLPFRAWPREAMHKIRSVPRDRDRNCWFCQTGLVGGLEGLVPGRNIEIDPTFTTTRTDVRSAFPDGPLERGRRDDDVGVSARWGVTPNLSLNAALNPDFSQVEADSAQLSVNRRFALYFPEKRPLFLEGADFFATPIEAVYTRTVADPSWGAKLTGKEGRNAVGVFVARDRVTNVLLPGNQRSDGASFDEPHTAGVARFRRDVGEASAIGALLTVREGARYHNRVGGFDAYLRFTPQDKVRFQALRSSTLDAGAAKSQSGNGVFAGYDHESRHWNAWLHLERRDPGFRADAGFVPRVDMQSGEAGFERVVWGSADRWFNRLSVTAEGWRDEDTSGNLLRDGLEVRGKYNGPYQSTVLLWANHAHVTYRGETFDNGGRGFFFNIRPTGDFTTSLDVAHYADVDAGSARGGRVLNVTPGLTYNLGRHAYTQLDHTFERFVRDGSWLYRANLTRLRLVYQFNVRLFARAIVERSELNENLGTTSTERTSLLGQYLVSYKVNPQTVVFAGYSDSRLGTNAIERTTRDRTFFLKLGYALLL